jgi:hypothetical protein
VLPPIFISYEIVVEGNEEQEDEHQAQRRRLISEGENVLNKPFQKEIEGEMASLLELTCSQRDQGWFYLRSFRITSSVSAAVLKALFNYAQQEDLDMQAIRALIGFSEYTPLEVIDTANITLTKLKEALRVRGIKGYSSVKSSETARINEMKDKLNNFVPLSQEEVVHQQLFKAWFLIKSAKSAPMVDGIANESNIVRGIHDFIGSRNDSDSVWRIDILCIRTCGLVINSNRRYLGGSVDALCAVRISGPNHQESICHVAMEAKTHFSADEIFKMEQRISSVGELSVCDLRDLRSLTDAHSNFAAVIPTIEHREQV